MLDITQMANRHAFMKNIHLNINLRTLIAVLVAVAIIAFSTLAANSPTPNRSSLTLKSIRTDHTTLFYADHRPACAWFVEAVYADHRPACAWFVEAVLPTGDSNVATDNLKSLAATL